MYWGPQRVGDLDSISTLFSFHYDITGIEMANLTLKGVPEPLVAELKKLAAEHRRSLNSEVIYRLEHSLPPDEKAGRLFVREADKLRKKIGIRTTVDTIVSARDEGRR